MRLTRYEMTSVILAFLFIVVIILYNTLRYVPNESALMRISAEPVSEAISSSGSREPSSASVTGVSSGVSSRASSGVAPSSRAQSASSAVTGKININTATKEELESIKWIGEVKAQSILDDRALNGRYNTYEDILRVKGIGEATLEKIRPYITLD